MGVQYRRSTSLGGGTRVNVSASRRGPGLSVSQRVGPLTLNSRGRASLRIMPGLSLRFGKRNDPVSMVIGLAILFAVLAVQVAVWLLIVFVTVVVPVLVWLARLAWFGLVALASWGATRIRARREVAEAPEAPASVTE